MATNLTNEQKVSLTVSPVTAAGNPASISGVPAWTSSNVNVISLTVAADGLSAVAFATGVGSATITVAANAGTAAAPVQITGTVVLNVTQSPAASLQITVGTPVQQ